MWLGCREEGRFNRAVMQIIELGFVPSKRGHANTESHSRSPYALRTLYTRWAQDGGDGGYIFKRVQY